MGKTITLTDVAEKVYKLITTKRIKRRNAVVMVTGMMMIYLMVTITIVTGGTRRTEEMVRLLFT